MKKTKNKNKYFFFLKESLSKFIVVFLVFSIFSSVSNVNRTYAYFSDSATVSGNTFTAGTLDISTSPDLGSVNLDTPQNYIVVNQGSLSFKYEMTTGISGGSDTTFCGQLNISVLNDTDNLYTGNLIGLNFTKLIGGAQDNLTFTITDPSHNSAGKICSFNLISKAWQVELDYSQGFTDTDSTKAIVYSANTNIPPVSSGVVLNEFLPNPNGLEYGFDFGEDGDSMPKGEWIELYNNADTSVDLTGWYIKDLANHTINITATNTQPATTTILAHKWLVIYMNASILNNSDPETITLYNNLNTPQDSYSYNGGTYCDIQPTSNDNNDTNPSEHCSSVSGNKSYARIPDGVGAWVDPIPTPGMHNELVEEIIPVVEEPVVTEKVNTDTTTETEDAIVPEVIAGIPLATEPEEVITEESEVVETPIGDVIEPEIIKTVEPVVTELAPVISETEPILESAPVVEVPAVESATFEPVSNEIK